MSITFVHDDDDFIVQDCPLPRPGDLIEHTDEAGTRSLWVVNDDEPYRFRTYPLRLATVFVPIHRSLGRPKAATPAKAVAVRQRKDPRGLLAQPGRRGSDDRDYRNTR